MHFLSCKLQKVVTSRACQQSRPSAATLRAFGLCMRHCVRRTVPGAALVEDSGSYASLPSAAGAATADGDVAAGGASWESNTIPSVPSLSETDAGASVALVLSSGFCEGSEDTRATCESHARPLPRCSAACPPRVLASTRAAMLAWGGGAAPGTKPRSASPSCSSAASKDGHAAQRGQNKNLDDLPIVRMRSCACNALKHTAVL